MKDQLRIVHKIRNFMVEKGISQWSEGSSKFIFNSVRSPDGALGFFMLLPKNPLKTYNSSKILNLYDYTPTK